MTDISDSTTPHVDSGIVTMWLLRATYLLAGIIGVTLYINAQEIVSQRRQQAKSVYNHCRFDVKKGIPVSVSS